MQINEENLKKVLSHLVSCSLKLEDAPISARQHLSDSIAWLAQMLPFHKEADWERNGVVEQAIYMQKLLGDDNEHKNST